MGACFHRQLREEEAQWGSLLREMTGYRDAVITLARRAPLRGTVFEVVGDAQPASYVSANGGSQVVDERTLILETPLDIFAVAEREGFEVRCRWVRRCFIQDAGDLRRFVHPMGYSLSSELLAYVWQRSGTWDLGRYASSSNTLCSCFNAVFDSVHVEGANVLTQDWRGTVSFVLPNYRELGKIFDITERDGAGAVLVVP